MISRQRGLVPLDVALLPQLREMVIRAILVEHGVILVSIKLQLPIPISFGIHIAGRGTWHRRIWNVGTSCEDQERRDCDKGGILDGHNAIERLRRLTT